MRPDEVDAATFDWQMRLVASAYHVLPLGEAVERLASGSLPARTACITFDDGYADNLTVATPILKRHGLTATFFVASSFLDGGRMWNDTIIEAVRSAQGDTLDLGRLGLGILPVGTPKERSQAAMSVIRTVRYRLPHERAAIVEALANEVAADLPDNLMMTSEMLRKLRDAGMSIGGHTKSHPILASTDEAMARHEIVEGKAQLEAILGDPVQLFAYPNGKPSSDYHAAHVRMVREAGFTAAVSTAWGTATSSTDRYQLPRFSPWDRNPLRFAARMLQNTQRRAVLAN
jgi:peptidoglycan/xylan/chitin deacetylase (PgdA/CDA1 family)